MKRRILWIGVTGLVAVALVLLSCGPAEVGEQEEEEEEAAKPEGTVVVRVATAYEEGFVPWLGASTLSLREIPYDFLVYTKMDLTTVGGLAEQWEASADALSITIRLRKGVPWQDGWGEVTAEDVKYTFQNIMSSGSSNIWAATLRKSVESIEIVDPYTIVFHLLQPDPMWWLNLTDVGNPYSPIVSKKYIEEVGEEEAMKQPVGSGPYRLVEHHFGDYLKFEALEDHWRVVPEFKYLIVKIVPERSTALAMLKTGVIDITQISSSAIPELEKAGFRVTATPGGESSWLGFGGMITQGDDRYETGYHLQDPWVDVRVREAMNIAIDRQAIIDAVHFGSGVPTVTNYPVPGSEKLKPYPYDPVRARQLLAEADAEGFSFNVMSWPGSSPTDIPKIIEAASGYWEEIGLKPKIVAGDYATYRGENINKGRTAGDIFPMGSSWRLDYSTMTVVGYSLGGQYGAFQSPELSASIERLLPELDLDKRNELWAGIAGYWYDNYVTIPIAEIRPTWAFSSKVEGLSPTTADNLHNYSYLRHAQPLNLFRLFELE